MNELRVAGIASRPVHLPAQVVYVSFTLNIIERELKPLGRIVRTCEENPTFEEVRHYLQNAEEIDPLTLYVCTHEADVSAARRAGCHVVFIGSDADEPAEGALLSVLADEQPTAVFDALLDIASRYRKWERAMDLLSLSGGSLQELVNLSEPFLKNNVVVLDPALKLVAYTKGVPCDDPITVELIEHGYHTEDNIRKFKLNRRFKSWANDDGFVINDTHVICKYTTIVKSFKSHSSFSIITVMMCNVSDDLPYLEDVFGMFANRVEYYARRDYPDDKPAGNAVDTFLKDLINNSVDEQAVIERSQFVGLPHEGIFCLFYTEPEENSAPASRVLSELALATAPAKTLLIDGAVAVLCFNCACRTCADWLPFESCPHGRQSSSERLEAVLERHDLTCGRSSKFGQLSHISTAFAQARAAFKLSQHAKTPDRNDSPETRSRIFPFDRHYAECLTAHLADEATILLNSTYTGRILDSIAQFDKRAHTNNYEFLFAYLAHERRTSRVAEELHMHRNNVGYRISRIEEQFGIDTEDSQTRLDLLFAYQIREATKKS